jgi:hypothetical protein
MESLKRGDDLKELFELLPDEIAQRIIVYYNGNDHYKNYAVIRINNGDGTKHGTAEAYSYNRFDSCFISSLLEEHKLAFPNFRYLHEFPHNGVWYFNFREFSNFAFAAIAILGELLGKTVQTVIRKKEEKTD